MTDQGMTAPLPGTKLGLTVPVVPGTTEAAVRTVGDVLLALEGASEEASAPSYTVVSS